MFFARASQMRLKTVVLISLIILTAVSTLAIDTASARRRRARAVRYRAALLLEADTGRVLKAVNTRQRLIPASIVKMMTILIALEQLEEKAIALEDIVTVTRQASRIGGQQVYLAQGETFLLEDLLKAVIISSANDAAYSVAEHIAGDVEVFIDMMNQRAAELGMTDSRFVNVHGLPPGRRRRANLMSARDVGILARELLRHPLATKWSRIRNAPFRNGKFILTNTNRLLGRFRGMDGLKTGYYRKAGFSIVATAKRGNLRLIAVVLGSSHSKRRFRETKRLLAWGFSKYRWVELSGRSTLVVSRIRILKGQKSEIHIEPQGKVRVLVRRGEIARVTSRAELPEAIRAPVQQGQHVGRIVYELGGNKLGEINLVAAEPVKKLSFFQNFIRLR